MNKFTIMTWAQMIDNTGGAIKTLEDATERALEAAMSDGKMRYVVRIVRAVDICATVRDEGNMEVVSAPEHQTDQFEKAGQG